MYLREENNVGEGWIVNTCIGYWFCWNVFCKALPSTMSVRGGKQVYHPVNRHAFDSGINCKIKDITKWTDWWFTPLWTVVHNFVSHLHQRVIFIYIYCIFGFPNSSFRKALGIHWCRYRIGRVMMNVTSLSSNKIWEQSTLKTSAEDTINVTLKMKFVLHTVQNVGKGRKWR